MDSQYTTIKMRCGQDGRLRVINRMPFLEAEQCVDRWLHKTPGLFGKVFKVDGGVPEVATDPAPLARMSPVRDRPGYVAITTPYGDELLVQFRQSDAEQFCHDNGWQFMEVDEAGHRPLAAVW